MIKPAYYNEIDPFAAQWLRNLIKAGHIAAGDVDERSITDVRPDDLRGYTQCHFFAGIGVWSLALRRAGWPDDRAVWTGSCPCQPFSVAGKSGGFADERHLWPHFYHLITQRRPATVFGEQVASNDGLVWFDLVRADLEGANYGAAAADLCAAGVGAPHIRQRLFWVGHANDPRPQGLGGGYQAEGGRHGTVRPAAEAGQFSGLADAASAGPFPGAHPGIHSGKDGAGARDGQPQRPGATSGLADTNDRSEQPLLRRGQNSPAQDIWGGPAGGSLGHVAGGVGGESNGVYGLDPELPGPTNGFWRAADWLLCRDGKWRPVEPGTFPLVNGASGRVGKLRAYGNCISPQVAELFIRAAMGVIQ